jgi:hypothetical protein
MRRIVVLALLWVGLAQAAPPATDSDDAAIMRGFESWIREQVSPARQMCCSEADGRPVEDTDLRQRDEHWEVFYSKRHWGAEATDTWVPVPPDAVLKTAAPFGMPVAWIFHGVVLCLSLGPQG